MFAMTDETKKDTLENKNETMDGRKDVESLKQEKVETFMQEMQDQDIDFFTEFSGKNRT